MAIGTVGIVIFGLLKGPPKPAPPSTFWQEPIPSQQLVADANYGDAIAAGRASLIERMQYFGTPGVSVAVAIRKEVVWAECFGYSDIDSKQWVDPLTKFRVASVSKPFTVALIAKLYEEGKIDWDAPVRTYLPNFPVKNYPVTSTMGRPAASSRRDASSP